MKMLVVMTLTRDDDADDDDTGDDEEVCAASVERLTSNLAMGAHTKHPVERDCSVTQRSE